MSVCDAHSPSVLRHAVTQGITQTEMEAQSASGSVLTPVTHMVLLQDIDETSVLE